MTYVLQSDRDFISDLLKEVGGHEVESRVIRNGQGDQKTTVQMAVNRRLAILENIKRNRIDGVARRLNVILNENEEALTVTVRSHIEAALRLCSLAALDMCASGTEERFKWPDPKFVPVESGTKLNPERVEMAFHLINGELVIGEQLQLIEMMLDGTEYTVAHLSGSEDDAAEALFVHEMAQRGVVASWNELDEDERAGWRESVRVVSTALSTLSADAIRQGEGWGAFRPMEAWDERDETVLLLVDYRGDGDHPLEDANFAVTVGHNNDHNVGDGEGSGWHFAGWCWSHDHYVEGRGKPVGWMPLPHILSRAYEAFETAPATPASHASDGGKA